MNSGGENNLKIRFRLPNGEEFEAEGPQAFIEDQRNYFLTLIGAKTATDNSNFSNTTPKQLSPYTIESPATVQTAQKNSAESQFWEQIFKVADGILELRYKAQLTPPELAVLLLAGAKTILKKDTYSALELAKSFKASGGPEGRLDRFLTSELQTGRILAEGSKRSRTYRLSEEGFARAFVLAQKLQNHR